MATVHIAITDIPAGAFDALSNLKSGDQILLEGGKAPVLLSVTPVFDNSIEATIARFEAMESEHGSPLVLDEDFAADLRDIVANREPMRDPWA